MKTEVRKEHGDWIVFVDDNPQFSFMYREEAEKVRNIVDALIEAREEIHNLLHEYETHKRPHDKLVKQNETCMLIDKALKDAGCEL